MVRALKTALLLTFLTACQAPDKNPEIATELKEMEDTAITSEKDGVAVEKPVLTETEEMPPLLVKQLDFNFPGWKIPEFSEKGLADLAKEKPNRFWIKGDFDKNRQEDYAVQVVLQDSVSVIAFLQQTRKDRFIHRLLVRGPLSRNEGEAQKSFYYLDLVSPSDSVYNGNLNRYHTFPNDAILVRSENVVKVFYFKAGKIKTLEIPGDNLNLTKKAVPEP